MDINIGSFGFIRAGMIGYKKSLHGYIRDRDSFGNIFFEDNEGFNYIFSPDQIDNWTEKNFKPLPDNVRWIGGEIIDIETRKKVDLMK